MTNDNTFWVSMTDKRKETKDKEYRVVVECSSDVEQLVCFGVAKTIKYMQRPKICTHKPKLVKFIYNVEHLTFSEFINRTYQNANYTPSRHQ